MLGALGPIPALRRQIEAFPVEHEGKPIFALRDLEEITDKSIAISPGGMMLASLFDGKRTATEVQATFTRATGSVIQLAEISRLAEELKKAGFLETPEIQEKRAAALKLFADSRVRKAWNAGAAYPAEPLQLGAMLGGLFKADGGPGQEIPAKTTAPAAPALVVSPHIDYSRGGPSYAWAYHGLGSAPPPDLILALGVAHASPDSPWVMTPKEYATPYGPMKVDQGLYDDVAKTLWYDPRQDEHVHRQEHSLELNAVWLKYLWRDSTPPWVPILTSTFERFCPDKAPSTVPTIEDAIQKIGVVLRERAKKGQRILILAGIDLAHVGPRFGDELELTPDLLKKIEAEDRESLAHALKLDADAFYLSTVRDGHWRKVCGLSALYTALRLVKLSANGSTPQGKLLSYAQAPDPAGGIVSFASAVYS